MLSTIVFYDDWTHDKFCGKEYCTLIEIFKETEKCIYPNVALQNLQNNIAIDDYETVLTGKSKVDFNDQNKYKSFVGDFDNVYFPHQYQRD